MIVQPGEWIAVLGGGQLGRMFCAAAARLGYNTLVISDVPNPPAAQLASQVLVCGYDQSEEIISNFISRSRCNI